VLEDTLVDEDLPRCQRSCLPITIQMLTIEALDKQFNAEANQNFRLRPVDSTFAAEAPCFCELSSSSRPFSSSWPCSSYYSAGFSISVAVMMLCRGVRAFAKSSLPSFSLRIFSRACKTRAGITCMPGDVPCTSAIYRNNKAFRESEYARNAIVVRSRVGGEMVDGVAWGAVGKMETLFVNGH